MKRNIRILFACLALWASSSAHSNGFKEFFHSYDKNMSDFIIRKSPPKIYNSFDLQADEKRLIEDGYDILGYSSFIGPQSDQKNAFNLGKKIRSEIIIINSRFVERVSGGTQIVMMPVIGGYGGMIGGAHPVSFDRYEQTAFFFAKLSPEKISWGVRWVPLTTQQATAIGSGKGVSVLAVVRGSPAFDANVLSGDIILAVAGQDISTPERLLKVKADYAGQSVPLSIIRAGQPQTLEIKLPTLAVGKAKK